MNIDLYNGLLHISRIAGEIDPRHMFDSLRLEDLQIKLCQLSQVLRETQIAVEKAIGNGETNVGKFYYGRKND